MNAFKSIADRVLNEFNVEDRNDPAFYDYAVLFVQQLKQRNMIPPGKDVRKTAMQIVKDQYYNHIDEKDNSAYKVEFVFNDKHKTPNNLLVLIKTLPDGKVAKEITNTHDESSINDVIEFLTSEQQTQQDAGIAVPEQTGDVPSELPGAVKPQTPNTSQYLAGL